VLADLAVADESKLLVGRQGAVEEEAGRNRTRGFGIALYLAAAETCDQIERPIERRRGDALAPVPLADEVAGDPPVRQGRDALLIGGPVLDLPPPRRPFVIRRCVLPQCSPCASKQELLVSRTPNTTAACRQIR
jgi:hypothetical protein